MFFHFFPNSVQPFANAVQHVSISMMDAAPHLHKGSPHRSCFSNPRSPGVIHILFLKFFRLTQKPLAQITSSIVWDCASDTVTVYTHIHTPLGLLVIVSYPQSPIIVILRQTPLLGWWEGIYISKRGLPISADHHPELTKSRSCGRHWEQRINRQITALITAMQTLGELSAKATLSIL